MPYVKREEYLKWLHWVRVKIWNINETLHCDLTGEPEYYLGFRGAKHRLCLLKDDYVYARGMKAITQAIYMLERIYGLCQH